MLMRPDEAMFANARRQMLDLAMAGSSLLAKSWKSPRNQQGTETSPEMVHYLAKPNLPSAVQVMVDKWQIKADVAGATFMAVPRQPCIRSFVSYCPFKVIGRCCFGASVAVVLLLVVVVVLLS